jgi:hypothetical protein
MMVSGLNDGHLDITPSTSIKTTCKCAHSNYIDYNAKRVQIRMSSRKTFQASSPTSNETNIE